MSLDIFITGVLSNAPMHLCITGVDLLRERMSFIFDLTSKSSIVFKAQRSEIEFPIAFGSLA
jgi:hypothetical protein